MTQYFWSFPQQSSQALQAAQSCERRAIDFNNCSLVSFAVAARWQSAYSSIAQMCRNGRKLGKMVIVGDAFYRLWMMRKPIASSRLDTGSFLPDSLARRKRFHFRAELNLYPRSALLAERYLSRLAKAVLCCRGTSPIP